MAEITMPRLSDTMSEGTVGRWLKQPGDTVEKGDILAEIETDKATMELEAFESGTLQKILIPEGQTVPIGEVIAMIGSGPVEPAAASASASDDDGSAPRQDTQSAQPVATESAPPTEEGGAEAVAKTTQEATEQVGMAQPSGDAAVASTQEATQQTGSVQTPGDPAPRTVDPGKGDGQGDATNGSADGRILASPLARRMAAEQGIDLRLVRGTGPGGRILKENVEEFAKGSGDRGQEPAPAPTPAAAKAPEPAPAQPAPAPAPAPRAPAPAMQGDEVTPMSRMRRAVSKAMTDSKPGVPHIYVTMEIDMAAAMQLRRQINEGGEVKVSVNDMVVKAAAKALLKFPAINSSYTTGADGQPAIARHAQVNVSVAVALEDGLIAPVVRDADKKSIGAVSGEIRDMAKRARDGKIKPNELDGATFQVSNLGMFDVMEFVSIITVPQAASLAVGAVRQTPVVRDGQLAVGEMMMVTLSADHRIADGAVAAQYLQELKRLLQAPMSLLV